MSNEQKYRVTLAGFIITFSGAILFSTKAIIVKLAFKHTDMNALSLLALRMLFSLPFYLGAAWMAARSKNAVSLTGRQWTAVIFLGLFGYYLSSLFDFVGLQYVTAGLERLILFLYPTFAVLINALIFKQPVSRLQKIALLLTYAGVAFAYWGELRIDMNNPYFLWGSFLIFLCSLTFAVYIAGSGKVIPKVGAARFTAYAMLASTGGVFIHFALAGNISAGGFSGIHWGYGLLLAIVATVLPSFMISGGLKRIGSSNVAIISAIGPVSTIVQAYFILDEPLFAEQIAGTALVIAGVLLIGWRQPKNAGTK
ncbi:DMT family transporter [Agriterribacter humi]|uniref:DMT family transporter n=1 Tax=Agriterribacter humi TaxID=1104781 RepID=UPI0012648D52|nr:DMT family transporter [Agriterribacter humi]